MSKHEHGFTLIEMLVVLMLIGMSAAIVLPSLAYSIRRKDQIYTIEQMDHIYRALNDYYDLHTQKLPMTLNDMKGNTILGIPKDGWGNAFMYDRVSDSIFMLRSKGSDNQVQYIGPGNTNCWQADLVITAEGWWNKPQGTQRDCP